MCAGSGWRACPLQYSTETKRYHALYLLAVANQSTDDSATVGLRRREDRVFFNDTAATEIYTLSLHDALPICALNECVPAIGLRAPAGWDGTPRLLGG